MALESKNPARVLVSASSKHGSTGEIADQIARTLGDRGFDVLTTPPDEVEALEDFDVVVLGSGVYAGRWLEDAKRLADRIANTRPAPSVWLFSSGPLGAPPKPVEDPVDAGPIVAATSARSHRVFAGRIDRSELNIGERAIMTAVRAPEGDFRNWAEITAWANEIADELELIAPELDPGSDRLAGHR